MDLDWNRFALVVFIDSNVALECLDLEQLPWREVHNTGPLLVLVLPIVLQEVGSKKNHARLGDHARRFNRKMRPLLTERATVVIRQSPAPQVEVALAECGPVDWQQYPNLDPEEADSKVVAQAIAALGPSQACRLIVSQDIRPLHLARRHGLHIYHIGENWLRPKERSESEKRADALKRELTAIKSREPELTLSFRANKDSVMVYQIRHLSAEHRKQIQDTIVRLSPMAEQKPHLTGMYSPFTHDYDATLEARYKRWQSEVIPRFMREYERKLELNFGQIEIVFRIENVGQVPAESLLIRLQAEGGWLNERYVLAASTGPVAPQVRSRLLLPQTFHPRSFHSVAQPGKHEFVVLKEPDRSIEVQIACADFRHGYEYEYRMIGWVDPHAEDFRVEAVVTAANLYGETKAIFTTEKTTLESSVSDLVDLETLKFHQRPEVVDLLTAAANQPDFSDFEFDGSGWDK
jgi:hypothetical protein